MKTIASLTFLAFTFCAAFLDTTQAQPLTVYTFAGKFNHNGYINGVGTNAEFHGLNNFSDLAADANGFLYVVDGNTIRRISPDSLVVTLAGNPNQRGYVDAAGTNALFWSPAGIAADTNGNVYVADGNLVIRKISPAGVVSTVAGNGIYGHVDSAAGAPEFQRPSSVALDSAGNIYVADYTTLRKITPAGVVSTLAGSQSAGFADGSGTNAEFISPFYLATKADGNIYVAMNSVIRKVTLDGVVSTFAGNYTNHTDMDGIGTNAGFSGAYSIALDKGGGMYVDGSSAGTIRYVTSSGVVTTVAGLVNRFPYPGSNNGVGTNAWFSYPQGIAVDPLGSVYIVDGGRYTILEGVPPALSPIGTFSESAGITPIRSNNPWQFTAHFTDIVSDLSLRVQSTTTTNVEGSWTDLPGNLHMTGVDGNWNLNTTNVPTGTNRYFRAVASAPGYFNSASRPEGPETVLGPPELPAITFSLLSTGGTPVRSSNPWQFLVFYTNVVSGLQLHVQSTTATNDEGSWSDLPGSAGAYMKENQDGTWTLNKTDVPTGTRYFRVVASALGYVDGLSSVQGPETVLPGFDLWGYFSYATSVPYSTHTPWSFAIGQPSQIPGMSLWVQSSETPDDPNSWTYLPGGAQMTRYSDGTTWVLYTTNVPTGATVSFRVIASAPDYVDLVSGELGTFDIGLPLPVHSTNLIQGATRTLQSTDGGLWAGIMHVIHVVGVAVHLIHDGTTTSQGAITLDADPGASVDLLVAKSQTLTANVNVRLNATAILSGTVDGNVSVGLVSHDGGSLVSHDGGSLVSHDGGSLVSHDGGSLVSHDGGSIARIAEIVAQGGGNIVAQGGGNIVAQGGGNIVAQGGGNIVNPQSVEEALSALTQTGNGLPHPNGLQPSFTGQMIINGNYDQFAGTLAIAIAGTNTLNDGAQQYDQLVVSGKANLIGGSIAVGLFNPDDQTNLDNVFQPPDGAIFDVVVASNIVVQTVQLQGRIWGDGLFFTGSVVTRTDGLQAVRLVATHYPPPIALEYSGPTLQLLYATNYTGYTFQSTPSLSSPAWSTFSTGTNVVNLSPTNPSQFFRLIKP